jgi:HlyD family secretion protein
MRRWLIRLLILGVLVGAAAAGAVPAWTWLRQRAAPKYVTAAVTRGLVETVVNSTGTVKPVRTVSVGAFTSGPIAEVYVDFNSSVKKDQILAVIDPKLLKATVERDKAAIDSQKADLERVEALLQQARNNEKRGVQLQAINKDYLSDTDMDTFKFTVKSLEAQRKLSLASIEQAKANLKNSEDNLGYTRILSPEDGVVIERKVDPGQTVAASFQTPELFTIALEIDQHMHIYASVDEADIGQIHAAKERDKPVKFTVDAYPGDLFEGEIDQIRMNSTTTQNVVTYPVIIKAPNAGRKLMPGMTANISFQVEAKENVLRVPVAALRYAPLAALVRPEDRHYLDAAPADKPEANLIHSAIEKAEQARNRQHRIVWVQEGPLLKAVPVTLGLVDNRFAELVDGGLAENQVLVTGTENPLAPR